MGEAAICLGVNLNLAGGDEVCTPKYRSHTKQKVDDNTPLPIHNKSNSGFDNISIFVQKTETMTASVKFEKQVDEIYKEEVESQVEITSKLRFSCQVCQKSLKDEITLNNHKCREGKIYNVLCKYCDQTFVSKKMLSSHKSIKHRHFKKERVVGPPFCSVCEKVFCNQKYLRKHQRKAHQDIAKEGEVSCGYCFGFYKTAFLSYHINLKHLKRKSEQKFTENKVANQIAIPSNQWLTCPTCYKRLREEVALKNHRCREGKIYNVKCKYCVQTFSSKKMMSSHKSMKHRHMKEEKIVRPPLCSVCEKVFCNTKYLRQHQRKAHQDIVNEGEVSCQYCFRFYKEAFLSHHINFKHPDQPTKAFKLNEIEHFTTS